MTYSDGMMVQGVAFFHAGSDILRSKSLDRDSYNSGDFTFLFLFSEQGKLFITSATTATSREDYTVLLVN